MFSTLVQVFPIWTPTSTHMDLIINKASVISKVGIHKLFNTLVLGFPPYEHEYSQANTHVYAHEPHYYQSELKVRWKHIK